MKLKPTVHQPVVDKIAYLLAWGMDPEDDVEQLLADVRQRLNSAMAQDRCKIAYVKGQRYKLNFWIKLNGDKNDALVQIGPLQDRQKGGMRVEVNPSKFGNGDVELLHRTLRRIVGHRYYNRLMQAPLLNVLHIAVDIENLNLSRTIVRYKHGHRMTVVSKVVNQKSALVETMNFGSVPSDYQTAVYDKRTERLHQLAKSMLRDGEAGAPLKANKVKQLKVLRGEPPMVRVEVRGRKLHGMPLHKLDGLTNFFGRFEFVALGGDPAKAPTLTLQAFISMVYQLGLKPALAAFKNTKGARAVHKFWRDRQCGWWQPDELWSHVPDAVRATRLFPPAAFEVDERADDGQPANEEEERPAPVRRRRR